MISVHFENPPLNEVVCGVHFKNLGWRITDFGKYHSVIEREYPKVTVVPAIPAPGAPFNFLELETDSARVWYEGTNPAYLLQVQKDRFLSNWRSRNEEEYPHFAGVFERFQAEWKRFQGYCVEKVSKSPEVVHFELSYINHLVQEREWQHPSDLSKLFKPLESVGKLEQTESFTFDVKYFYRNLPINVSIKRGARKADNKSLFIVELTVQKFIENADYIQLFQEAHKALTEQFKEMTTVEAHLKWGLANV